MRAVVFDGQLRFTPSANPRNAAADEVNVSVTRAGICETDLQLCRGYMGFQGILGHEFVGVAGSGRFAGRRVVGEINCSCRTCETCLRGDGRHCPSRTVIGIVNHDGAFAETVIVPEVNLHAVPDGLSDEEAVFVEPLAAACRIPEQVSLGHGTRVTILGDGRLGHLCAQVLRHHDCSVQVIGRHEFKLNLLKSLGFSAGSIDDLPPRRVSDVVVDCTGSTSGLPLALQFVRPRGTIVLKTTVAAEQTLHLAPVVIDEVTLVGSRCGPFEPALALLSSGAVSVTPLISASYGLEEAEQAFAHAVRKDALKVQFRIR